MHILARGAIAMTFGAIASLTAIHEAGAASSVCRRLEAQLTAGGGQGNSRTDSLIARQRAELGKARGQLARCGFVGSGGRCDSLRSTIRRMERNLAGLQSRSGGSGRSRARILAALDANGCRGGSPQKLMVVRKAAEPSLLSAFFGEAGRGANGLRESGSRVAALGSRLWNNDRQVEGRRYEQERGVEYRGSESAERRPDAEPARRSADTPYERGSLQSVCVRLSDGYYFPISPASTRGNLARDRNNCQAMCPDSEVSVYYKRLDEDDVDAMISADTGKPYRALKTANLYREQPSAGCSGDRQAARAALAETRTVDFEFPVPSPKPDSDNTIPLWIGSADAAVQTPPPQERKVRIVGPAFLPDPPTGSVRPVQDQTPVL